MTGDSIRTDRQASSLSAALFALTPLIRYVAVAVGQAVTLNQREGLVGGSAAESDRYEELFVNPALLTLARQRGEVDCGGLRFVCVGYGNFHQLVIPHRGGHVSIAFELDADPLDWLEPIATTLASEAANQD